MTTRDPLTEMLAGEKLLPCPFCGQAPGRAFQNLKDVCPADEEDDWDEETDGPKIVKCWTIFHNCNGVHIGVDRETERECIEAWNTRIPTGEK